jgi:hypothetical protein
MKLKNTKVTALAATLITFGSLAGGANAATLFSFTPPASAINANVGVDGFIFTPTVDILVTSLGYYDQDGDGLPGTFEVGVYDVLSQSLVAPTVSISSSSSLGADNFRYEAIPALSLNAGQEYLLAGFAPVDAAYAASLNSGLTVDTDVTYGGYFYDFGGTSLFFPTSSDPTLYFGGPNLQFSPVPEPASALLLGLGGLGFLIRRRTK